MRYGKEAFIVVD
jgi:hypothetical protein